MIIMLIVLGVVIVAGAIALIADSPKHWFAPDGIDQPAYPPVIRKDR
jgi:hypothetical protein